MIETRKRFWSFAMPISRQVSILNLALRISVFFEVGRATILKFLVYSRILTQNRECYLNFQFL